MRKLLLLVMITITGIVFAGCQQAPQRLEPPFDTIIPHGIKTAPTITDEGSRSGENLKGTYYEDNNIIASHYRGCVGKDVNCGMTIEVLSSAYEAEKFFKAEVQEGKKFSIFSGQQMFSYFAKQKPDDVFFYQLELLPDFEREKPEVEYGIRFRVGRYVGLYFLDLVDPMMEPDPYSSNLYYIGYDNLEALWVAVDRTIPQLRALGY
jgi:hypothetical protein